MTEEESSTFTTKRRSIGSDGELKWGGEDGEQWSDAVESSENITVTDNGTITSGSKIPDSDIYQTDNFDYREGTFTVNTTEEVVELVSDISKTEYLFKDLNSDVNRLISKLTGMVLNSFDHANYIYHGFSSDVAGTSSINDFVGVRIQNVGSPDVIRFAIVKIVDGTATATNYVITENINETFKTELTINDGSATLDVFENDSVIGSKSLDVSDVNYELLDYYGYSGRDSGTSGIMELNIDQEDYSRP